MRHVWDSQGKEEVFTFKKPNLARQKWLLGNVDILAHLMIDFAPLAPNFYRSDPYLSIALERESLLHILCSLHTKSSL